MSTSRNLISVREAARVCDVCTKTLQNWQRSGQPVPILVGGGVAYDPRTLKRFLARGGPRRSKPGVKKGTKWSLERKMRLALNQKAQ